MRPQDRDWRRYRFIVRFQPSTIVLIGFLACTAVLGAWRMHRVPAPNHVERTGTGAIVLEGRIDGAPEIADTSISYVVSSLSRSGAVLQGSILIRDTRMWPRHFYGERIRVTGKLEPAEHDGYGASLRSRGIQATMYGPRIEMLDPAPLSAFGTLTFVRESIEGHIRQIFPEPEASLAVGLLTGTRASFPDALTEDLRTSGLTHIVAISGSNVAIVLVMMESLLFWLPRRWRLLPLLVGIALFVVFTGASASVVRAGIMGGLSVLALHAGRVGQARRTIAWTAGLMLLWNPLLLTNDLGFQLSFLSVLGILEVSPHLESLLKRVPNVLGLRESIALTLASQAMAAPWIAYKLGNLSLVALPANLLAAPLIPWSMLLGFLAFLFSFLGLGLPVAFVAAVPLALIIAIADYSAAVPYAALDGLTIPLWTLLPYYAALASALVWLKRHTKNPAHMMERGPSPYDQDLRIMLSSDRRPAP